MDLYLVRHGIAVERGTEGVRTDADRMLSEEGQARTGAVARGLSAMGCAPGRIASSPLVRAWQTAEIMARDLDTTAEPEVLHALAIGSEPEAVVDWLAHQDDESIMLVGHMPDMAELASLLLAGDAPAEVRFKKAAVACFSFVERVKAGHGCLEWLLQPRQLRMLGKAGDPAEP
jgi:phosphohistidine phosphatase